METCMVFCLTIRLGDECTCTWAIMSLLVPPHGRLCSYWCHLMGSCASTGATSWALVLLPVPAHDSSHILQLDSAQTGFTAQLWMHVERQLTTQLGIQQHHPTRLSVMPAAFCMLNLSLVCLVRSDAQPCSLTPV